MDCLISQKYDVQISKLITEKHNEIRKYTLENGFKNGDLTIICKDGQMKVFSEVLNEFSEFYKGQSIFQNEDNKLNLSNFSLQTTSLVMQDLYKSNRKYQSFDIRQTIEYFMLADYLLLIGYAYNTFEERAKNIMNYRSFGYSIEYYLDKVFPYIDLIINTKNVYLQIIIKSFTKKFESEIHAMWSAHEFARNCSCYKGNIPCTYIKVPSSLRDFYFNVKSDSESNASEDPDDIN